MSQVLVTGAGGYLGTTLVPMLLQSGYSVRAVDRFFFGRSLLKDHPNLDIVCEDTRRLAPEHFEGVTAVIDLAALSNDPTGELFKTATWDINCSARARAARLARDGGCARYILPSSCSIYGWQAEGVVADEATATNPLTTYAQANKAAEDKILPLASDDFCVVVLRQATIYGYSPRMRFDLAINGMTYGAWKSGKLPLMRDGTQWRPMLHVRDAAAAISFMIAADATAVCGEIFNVGSEQNNYRISDLGDIVARMVPRDVEIEWYGDPDERSYRISSKKIEALGYSVSYSAEDGVRDVSEALESGLTDRTPQTITLEWYKRLVEWHQTIRQLEMYGGIIDINSKEFEMSL